MNSDCSRKISSKWIRWLLCLCSICFLSSVASTTPPLLFCFLYRRLLFASNSLNPDRHCPSVVMTTIWRSLTVAQDMFFMLLCWCFTQCRVSLLGVSQPLGGSSLDCILRANVLTLRLHFGDEKRLCWQKSMANEPWNFFFIPLWCL